jgi:small subunit ribosomal protein S6
MNIRRVYETTIIINAALEEPDTDAVISKISSYIENHGGIIEETDKWGRRRLAYPINKKFNGYYVHIVFNIQPTNVPTIERFLVLEDTILRHLTLQLEPEMREFRKERSLAEGKSGETTISSSVEVERPAPKPFKPRGFILNEEIAEENDEIISDEIEIEEFVEIDKDIEE